MSTTIQRISATRINYFRFLKKMTKKANEVSTTVEETTEVVTTEPTLADEILAREIEKEQERSGK